MSVTQLPLRTTERSGSASDDASGSESGVDRTTPAIGLPGADQVVAWVLRVLGELGRAPFTLYHLRRMVHALGQLPDQLDELIATLNHTTETLDDSLGRMDGRIEALQGTFAAVDDRLGNLEGSVNEVSATITNLIAAIPGARRTLKR